MEDQVPLNFAEQILAFSEDRFFLFLSALIHKGPPSAQPLRIIAYQNLEILMRISADIAKTDATVGAPVTINDHIRCYERLKNENREDEFAVRRMSWFFEAALLKRAEFMAFGNPEFENILAGIWIDLAEGCSLLAETVKMNRLWSDEEKQWYNEVKTEKDGIQHCLWLVAPREIRRIEKVREYAEGKDIFLMSMELEEEYFPRGEQG